MQSLLDHPRESMDADLIQQALEWQHGLKVRFGWDVLDSSDVPTGEVIPALSGGRVGWASRVKDEISSGSGGTSSTVRRTATLPLGGPTAINVLARRFRPWCAIKLRDGEWATFYRGVFISSLPPLSDDGVVVTRELELAGKEHRYSLDELGEPKYVATDTDVLLHVKSDLQTRYSETSFDWPAGVALLPQGMAFEHDTTRLDYYNTLLGAVGYGQLHCNDVGKPRVRLADELETKAHEWPYEPGTTQLPGGDVEAVLPELPNKLEFVADPGPTLPTDGNGKFTLLNQSTGPASIDQRGFPVFKRISLNVPVDPTTGNGQPALEAKGRQIAQRLFAGGGYHTRGSVGFNPLHSDDDVVRYVKPRLELTTNAEWLVTEWEDVFDATSGETELALELRVVIS